jgi:hypothetical protein
MHHSSCNTCLQGIWTPGTGSDSVTPIFIVGFVRSGSTLLERILDSHHLIAGTGEGAYASRCAMGYETWGNCIRLDTSQQCFSVIVVNLLY